jgi:K+-sensing histidine kinase KdpD
MLAPADPQLMRIVLENLLRNAWKFTSRHPTANITFGSRAGVGGTEYFVRDDGAGFTTEGAANLFNLFHRLHHASEFDGIGIGLVTVQRIVQRHGGRIRAEGEQERGAVFYFTLG